jgi:hypothetical protein
MPKKLVILLVLLIAISAHPHQKAKADCPVADTNKLYHGTFSSHLRSSTHLFH